MIGIIGGTGPEGFGLAVRWSIAGESIVIGSRSEERAQEAAGRIRSVVPRAAVGAGSNVDAARASDVIVVAVPWPAVAATVQSLAGAIDGKIAVSVVAALEWIDGRPRPVSPAAGSAAQEIQELLPTARVTSGFQTLSAEKLGNPSTLLDEDTIICGDDRDTRRAVMELAAKIDGIRPISGGRLENSFYPELMVGMLATLNRIHKVHVGLRVVGLDRR